MAHALLCVLWLNLLYCGHAQDSLLTIEPNWSTFFTGESVTFTCDMRDGRDTDWYCAIMKDGQQINPSNPKKNLTVQPLARGDSGEYQCFGHQGLYSFLIESNTVSLTVSDRDVILEHPAPPLYEGETVTLRCRHRTQGIKKSAAFYRDGSLLEESRIASRNTAEIRIGLLSGGSAYTCAFDEDESEAVKLKVETDRPVAELRRDRSHLSVGDNVTLSCSVSPPSSGWKYFWYRGKKTSEPLTAQDAVFLSDEAIRVSRGGVYWCRGGRGDPVYYTEFSVAIVTYRAAVTLQPAWPEIYHGETVTLSCEIKDGEDAEWEYEWAAPSSYTPQKSKYMIRYAHNGDYRCMGTMRGDRFSTEWSDAFTLTLSYNKPKADLAVSPLWLSPGDSVTLSCEVEHPSAGWRFYWYKVVPKLPDNSYSYELLPGSSNGTQQRSYIVHGQTGTAGFKCRAGRGDPVYYTFYSDFKFVWSGECHSGPSLTVSPDRAQHFIKDSLTLSCEGNSSRWRVIWFPKSGYSGFCSSWGIMAGSTCNTHRSRNIDGVYWCESDAGRFSNAVNITGQYGSMILVSPVHPVAEGHPVTLSCKLKSENALSNVVFYKNNLVVQNDTRTELTIPAASKADEGLYKCRGKASPQNLMGWTSPDSWMSVKSASSPHSAPLPVPLIVGTVCGALLVVLLLLLLYRYTKSRGEKLLRSQSTNQDSAADHMINQDKEYTSVDDYACLYEMVKGPKEAETDEPNDITYSLIHLKHIVNKGMNNEPEESAVYSNMKIGSAAGTGKSNAEVVYSEVRPGTARGNDAVINVGLGLVTVMIHCTRSSLRLVALQFRSVVREQVGDAAVRETRCFAAVKGGSRVGLKAASVCLFVRASTLDVRMRPSTRCVSTFFFITVLNTLLHGGHAQDAELTLQPNLASFFSGESVTFTCDMKVGAITDWYYRLTQNGRQIASFSTNNLFSLKLTAHSSGSYQCVGRKNSADLEKQSNNVTLTVSARRPKATLTADRKSIPEGSTVTLHCSVGGSAGWTYEWFKRTPNSDEALLGTESSFSISRHGLYWCRGSRGKTPAFLTEDSDVLRLEITLSVRASVTIQQQKWTHIFSGEEIAVMCEIEGGGGGDAGWEYEWRTDSSNTPAAHREYRIGSASPFHSGQYWCKGRRDSYSSTEWSEAFQLTVLPRKPTAELRGTSALVGGTLTCSVEDPAEWKYYWFRRPTVFSESEITGDGGPDSTMVVSEEGIYHCRAGRGSPSFFTEDSRAVVIEKRVSEKAVVSLKPNGSLIFAGEAITVRCEVNGGGEWEYEWSTPDSNALPAHSEWRISSAAVSHSGNYRCMGKLKSNWYSSTEWSEVMALTVSPHRPKANLSAESGSFPAGGSVTLTCSVSPSSSGWEYFWYRGHKSSERLAQGAALSTWQVSVSRGGLYWCRGGRGDPVYYTEFSDPVSVNAVATNRAVLTLRPNWPKIYSEEAVSLRCDVQGEDAEWEYEWATTSSYKPPNQKEYRISSVSLLNGGEYWCKGRLERSQHGSTAWSSNFALMVYNDKPKPVLKASPLWLSSGDSVTLSCEVEHPSAGWRFYWYKAVPNLSDDSYTYEPLPDSSSRGTEQGSYTVRGQTGSAGYVCRAGRGDPMYYTHYSQPEFVFSGDLHSEASLTVSPDRVQHFTSDHVSLRCERNSTRWRVMRLTENSYASGCSHWGTMSGSTCSIPSHGPSSAVYWCESESGELSSAVNITGADDIILVSPVHSVAEGEFVSLGCQLKTEQPLSNVTFYKNEQVIQSDASAMLNISAASKSDEGFYKCQHSGSVSSESWLSVRSSSSPSPASLIVGLVFGILLVLLLPLLLLCWYKKLNATFCHRPVQSQRTNQSSATVQNVRKEENEEQIYSLLQGDVCVYDTISGGGITESGICDDPADSCEYGNMNLDSGTNTLFTTRCQSHLVIFKRVVRSPRVTVSSVVFVTILQIHKEKCIVSERVDKDVKNNVHV
ncbi:uncharacterized protein LOC143317455 [Chaetodon auriga]|uniref:uncharacterized protein LOC143317455 n=1 Tax=Chaetodon auriga TaxID=39042 RepID=UPI004032B2B5